MSGGAAKSVAALFPPGQAGRYLVVGVSNTLFAWLSFAALNYVLDARMAGGYLVASLASSVLNITVSFLGYKWFVFRTKGNYLREWLRCLVVYSGNIALGLACLPPTVLAVTAVTGRANVAPYVAAALLLLVQAATGFLGHRNFSFSSAADDAR